MYVTFSLSRHYFAPYAPCIPGLEAFPGRSLHSHSYRDAAHFAGQSVLVVGAGPSGIDIMLDLARQAKAVYLSCHGNLMARPLPGNVEVVPDTECVNSEGRVHFAGGKSCLVDSIVLCTGYCYDCPFLTPAAGVSVADRRICGLYKHTFSALHPSLAFIGLQFRVLPFPYFELQVKWILGVWSGAKRLPSTVAMLQDAKEELRGQIARGIPLHRAHFLGPLQWDFYKHLSELGGSTPLDPMLQSLYTHIVKCRVSDPQGYKERGYAISSESDEGWTEVHT